VALPASNRIKKKKDFDMVFKKGKAVNGSFLFIKSVHSSRPRFGFIVASKFAPQAVLRNKVRRLFADVLWPDRLPNMAPCDTVVVVTKKVPQDLALLREDFLAVLRNARIG
jgi:ribonuclease P protein component